MQGFLIDQKQHQNKDMRQGKQNSTCKSQENKRSLQKQITWLEATLLRAHITQQSLCYATPPSSGKGQGTRAQQCPSMELQIDRQRRHQPRITCALQVLLGFREHRNSLIRDTALQRESGMQNVDLWRPQKRTLLNQKFIYSMLVSVNNCILLQKINM